MSGRACIKNSCQLFRVDGAQQKRHGVSDRFSSEESKEGSCGGWTRPADYNNHLCFTHSQVSFSFFCLSLFFLNREHVCLGAPSAEALQDPGVYGVIQSGDHKARTCVVKWIKLNSTSDDVEVRQRQSHRKRR